MDVSLALLADYANVSQEGKLNIMGVFNRISADAFPVVHPEMRLVVSFEAGPSEKDSTKHIEIKLLDDDDNVKLTLATEMPIKIDPPKLVFRANQILNLQNVRFEKAGDYRFDILVGGELKRSAQFVVEERPRQ